MASAIAEARPKPKFPNKPGHAPGPVAELFACQRVAVGLTKYRFGRILLVLLLVFTFC